MIKVFLILLFMSAVCIERPREPVYYVLQGTEGDRAGQGDRGLQQ